jgi:hypothetical protein
MDDLKEQKRKFFEYTRGYGRESSAAKISAVTSGFHNLDFRKGTWRCLNGTVRKLPE